MLSSTSHQIGKKESLGAASDTTSFDVVRASCTCFGGFGGISRRRRETGLPAGLAVRAATGVHPIATVVVQEVSGTAHVIVWVCVPAPFFVAADHN